MFEQIDWFNKYCSNVASFPAGSFHKTTNANILSMPPSQPFPNIGPSLGAISWVTNSPLTPCALGWYCYNHSVLPCIIYPYFSVMRAECRSAHLVLGASNTKKKRGVDEEAGGRCGELLKIIGDNHLFVKRIRGQE